MFVLVCNFECIPIALRRRCLDLFGTQEPKCVKKCEAPLRHCKQGRRLFLQVINAFAAGRLSLVHRCKPKIQQPVIAGHTNQFIRAKEPEWRPRRCKQICAFPASGYENAGPHRRVLFVMCGADVVSDGSALPAFLDPDEPAGLVIQFRARQFCPVHREVIRRFGFQQLLGELSDNFDGEYRDHSHLFPFPSL